GGAREKENIEPLPVIATVAERIAMSAPAAASGPSVLGKRPSGDDEDDDVQPPKRAKLDLPAAPLLDPGLLLKKSEDEPLRTSVFFQDVPSTPKRPKTPHSTSEPRTRKRKGVFMEAVEVPTYKEVLRREEAQRRRISLYASLPRRAASSVARQSATSSKPAESGMRRTHSAVKATEANVAESERDELPETPTKKRKSRGAVINGNAEAGTAGPSSSMSSSLRALRKAPVLGSDDSILHATPSKLLPKEHSSSDDDPRLGQVNPVGLSSPALRRVKAQAVDLSDPPSSDDSVMSNSPSRDLVKRRIARLPGSVDRRKTLDPSPLKTRMVAVIDLTRDDD
ncbi:hypothetical protein EVJ58_g8273, partial [Rhodofomes roseus]